MQKGQTVETIQSVFSSGSRFPAGTRGVVFWMGVKFDEPRCGFKTAAGETVWAAQDLCKVVDAAIKSVKASGKKSSGQGPRVFCKANVEAQSAKAILVNGEWWPRSQAFLSEGWLCATEWIVKQKFNGVIPACFLTKAGMEAEKAKMEASVTAEMAAVVTPAALAAEEALEDNWGEESWVATAKKMGLGEAPIEPPPGSWAATARMMASGDDSGFDWDLWKDEMKMRDHERLLCDDDTADAVISMFED